MRADGDRVSRTFPRGNPTLAGALLPTPTATNSRGNTRNGQGEMLLPGVVRALLPTPIAGEARHGGQGQANNGGPMLTTVVLSLLPTPQSRDTAGAHTPDQVEAARARSPRRAGGGRPGVSNLNDKVAALLPTPAARDSKGRDDWTVKEGSASLPGTLLPTPSVADALGGHWSRGGDRSDELLLGGVAKTVALNARLLPTPAAHEDGRTPQGHLASKPGRVQVTSLSVVARSSAGRSATTTSSPPSGGGNTSSAGRARRRPNPPAGGRSGSAPGSTNG